MEERIPIGGMKFSEELALLALGADRPPPGAEAQALQALARHQINVFFLSISRAEDRVRVCLCVSPERAELAASLAAASPAGTWSLRSVAAVGLIAFYPHDRRLEAFTRSLRALEESGLPVYGASSSLAAITLVSGFERLSQAGETLRTVLALPESHAPFQPEFRVKPIAR